MKARKFSRGGKLTVNIRKCLLKRQCNSLAVTAFSATCCGQLIACFSEPSFPVLVVENGFVQVFFSEVRPANIGKIKAVDFLLPTKRQYYRFSPGIFYISIYGNRIEYVKVYSNDDSHLTETVCYSGS
jgi:hypothetical protein